MTIFYRCLPLSLLLALVLVSGPGCTRAARAKRMLAKADRDFSAKKNDDAEIEYRSALRLSFLNHAALRGLGLVYVDEGRPSEAFPILRKALQQEPHDTEVEIKLAGILMEFGQLKDAVASAQRVLVNQPANAEALQILVEAVRSPNDVKLVRQELEKLRTENSDNSAYHVAAAEMFVRQRDLTDGERELQQALVLDPKSAEAYFLMAEVFAARKDLKQAGQAFDRAAQLAPLRSPIRIKYADFKVGTHDTEGARKDLVDLTAQAPDYFPAWFSLMKLYYAEKKYDDCLAVIHTILARDPSNFEARMQSGTVSMAQGDVAKGISEFESLDGITKKSPQVKFELALAYLRKQDANKAMAYLKQSLDLDTNYTPAIMAMADLNIRTGQSGAAIISLAQLVKKQPQNNRAHLLLADAYLAERRPQDALEVYRKMEEQFPKNPQIPLMEGSVWEQEKNLVEARKSFERALALAPDYLVALEDIISLDLAEKQYKEAMDLVKVHMESNPHAAQPWLLAGQIYWAQGQTNETEQALLKAIELSPDSPTPYLLLSHVYIAAHKQKEALDRLNTLVQKTNDVSALLQIGMIHGELKEYKDARDAYEKLLSVNPKYVPALNNLAYIYSEQLGQLDKAEQLAQTARDANPYDPYTADTLGWIVFKKADYARALPLLVESAEKQPDDPEVQMHLGMAYYMMGEEDPARLALQRAVSSHRDFTEKEEARQHLATLAIDPATASPAVIEQLKKQLSDDPNDIIALDRMAAIEQRTGDPSSAASAYQTVIKRNPKNWQAIIKLSELYSGPLNDFDKALDLAKQAHTLVPEEPEVLAQLGHLAYHTHDYPWSLSLLEQAAITLGNQPAVLYDLALGYYSVGRIGEADASMQKAQANASPAQLADARRFLAMRAASLNSAAAQAALPDAQKILETTPDYVPALMVQGLSQESHGDYKSAADTYQKALAVYPLFVPADRQLAILYADHLGDDVKASQLGEKARPAYRNDTQLARSLGLVAYRQANYPKSALLLLESLRNYSSDGEVNYYLGMDYYRLKQRSESKQALQRALAANIPASSVTEAKRVLAELK